MKSLTLRIILILIFILNSSCIHLNSTEYRSVEIENTKAQHQETIIFEKLQIENLVYTESVYPLEEFLSKLLSGDFKEILNKIDLKYKPSNTDNKIILELIKEGLVPVYVNIKNTGPEPIKISEKNFYLSDGDVQIQALNFDRVPRSYERFNSKAVAANTYNISVVVIGTIVALAVLGIIFRGASLPSGIGSGGSSKSKYSSGSVKGRDSEILNDTHKTTRIDYRDYLISEKTIESNESLQGLLFFRYKSKGTRLSLKFQQY